MINPDFKATARPGIKGSLSFDHQSSTANPVLFKELKGLIAGVQGITGAGGEHAQRLDNGNHFSQSAAFKNAKERDAVQYRLDKQLTEALNNKYGSEAAKMGMSVPALMQTQGIHGISEIGEGDNRRMTAYSKENFKRVSFNPLVGSNERSSQALVRQAGHSFAMSGGMGENKRLTSIVSTSAAKELEERTKRTQIDLETGFINMGDLEGASLSRADRIDVKNRRRAVTNNAQSGSALSENSALVERVRSEMIKKDQMTKLERQTKTELQNEGLIEPDKEKEDKSGSGKGTIAKGAAFALRMVQSAVGKISNIVVSMLGVLKKISSDMGRLMKDSAEVGIDVNTADKMRKWGIGNSTYSGGNEFIQLDAVKAFNAKAGDITKVGSVNFDNMAYQGYGGLIKGVVQSAVNQSPLEGTKAIYNSMAKTYMNAGSPEAKQLELKKQVGALNEAFGADFSAGYSSMLRASEAQGLINKDNAGNMWGINMSNKNVDGLKSIGGSNVNEFIPGAAGAMDLAGNTKMLNDVLGDMGKIQNALYMMLLSNMDIIIQILLGIAKGLLGIMAKFDVNGAAEGLSRLEKAENKMAKSGQINLDTNVAKAEVAAKAEIRANLKKKGLAGDELEAMTDAAFAGGSKGDLSGIPEKYRDSVTGSVVTKLAVANTGKKKSKDIYNDTIYGSFNTSGLLGNMFQDAASEQKGLLSKLGLGEYNASQKEMKEIEESKIGLDRKKKIIGNAYGLGSTSDTNMSPEMFAGLYFASPTIAGMVGFNREYTSGLYPDEQQKPIMLPSGVPGAADSDLKGLPFFPKAKPDLGGLDFSKLSGLATDTASKQAAISGASGTPSGGEPFTINNKIDLTVNGKDMMISTNTASLAEDSKKRTFISNAQVGMPLIARM